MSQGAEEGRPRSGDVEVGRFSIARLPDRVVLWHQLLAVPLRFSLGRREPLGRQRKESSISILATSAENNDDLRGSCAEHFASWRKSRFQVSVAEKSGQVVFAGGFRGGGLAFVLGFLGAIKRQD